VIKSRLQKDFVMGKVWQTYLPRKAASVHTRCQQLKLFEDLFRTFPQGYFRLSISCQFVEKKGIENREYLDCPLGG